MANTDNTLLIVHVEGTGTLPERFKVITRSQKDCIISIDSEGLDSKLVKPILVQVAEIALEYWGLAELLLENDLVLGRLPCRDTAVMFRRKEYMFNVSFTNSQEIRTKRVIGTSSDVEVWAAKYQRDNDYRSFRMDLTECLDLR